MDTKVFLCSVCKKLLAEQEILVIDAHAFCAHCHEVRVRVLGDIPLVLLGTMSVEQCISYAQQDVKTIVTVTPEQAAGHIQALRTALTSQ